MSAESDIRASIRAIVGNFPMSVLGTVVSVDEDEMTCEVEPIDGGASFMDVRLMADNEDTSKGIFFKPAIDSVVMITPQDEVTYFVSMVSEVDEVWLHGDQYGGIVKVADLVTKLNNLEGKVNDLVTAFNSHVHTGVTTGGGSSGTTATQVTGTLTPTQRADIENTDVKHG
jgi:hypothetical protein